VALLVTWTRKIDTVFWCGRRLLAAFCLLLAAFCSPAPVAPSWPAPPARERNGPTIRGPPTQLDWLLVQWAWPSELSIWVQEFLFASWAYSSLLFKLVCGHFCSLFAPHFPPFSTHEHERHKSAANGTQKTDRLQLQLMTTSSKAAASSSSQS